MYLYVNFIRSSIKKQLLYSLMEQLFDKYNSLYKQEFVEDEDTENNFSLTQYDFKTPIEYTNTNTLNETVKNDIEFNGSSNLYSTLLKTNVDDKESLLLGKWSSVYTTNKYFLKDNQTFLKNFSPIQNKMHLFAQEYIQFKNEQNFLSKYQYIQFRRFFYLNTMISFLQILALYNICSPLLSLLSPLIGIITPYFIFYFKGIKMSFGDYMKFVKKIILNNNIIKNLLNFRKGSMQTKLYSCVYLFFYGMGVYQNINSCIQFYKNTNYIIEFNEKYNTFLSEGSKLIQTIHSKTKNLKEFEQFNDKMLSYQSNIHDMSIAISTLKKEQKRYIKYGQVGLLLKCNFDLFYNNEYYDTIMYLTYLNQYNQDAGNLSYYIQNKKLSPCKYIKSTKKTKIKDMYYLPHIHESNIRNTINMNKNIIITGPNASGKTTLIKSTIINLFLSQSIGFGCYKKCKLNMYDYFHSYLNIPDTSNRDSLFQAEARRCKDIYEFIQEKKNKKHLCIFDEIYSGTNPNDAVLCANVYLNGMNQYKSNVDYVLTTHYLELCKKYENDTVIQNKQMNVIVNEGDDIKYTYKLIDGISEVHGGFQVLQNLDYPDELLKKKS